MKEEQKPNFNPSRKTFVLSSQTKDWKSMFSERDIVEHLKKQRHSRSKNKNETRRIFKKKNTIKG